MALYNEMRPEDTKSILGQPSIVKRVEGIIQSGVYPQAMAFTGPAGTGKTTTARILAKAANCLNPTPYGACGECESCKAVAAGSSMDIVEMDAASNNGVADVHAVIESANYSAIGKYKVYIIDEAHMLSKSAWNAFLKIVEEPPKGVIFIFCTTELNKIPATIVSRCRHFAFGKITADVILSKLRAECEKYGKEYEEGALRLIAKAAKGGMRTAESILESFFHEDLISQSIVEDSLGLTDEMALCDIVDAISAAKADALIDLLRNAFMAGRTPAGIAEGVMEILKDTVYLKEGGDEKMLYETEEYIERLRKIPLSVEMGLDFIARLSAVPPGASEGYMEALCLKFISEIRPVEIRSVISSQECIAPTDVLDIRKELNEIRTLLTDGVIPESWECGSDGMNPCPEPWDDEDIPCFMLETNEEPFEPQGAEDEWSGLDEDEDEDEEIPFEELDSFITQSVESEPEETAEPVEEEAEEVFDTALKLEEDAAMTDRAEEKEEEFDFASFLPAGACISSTPYLISSDENEDAEKTETAEPVKKSEENPPSIFGDLFADFSLPGFL